MGEQVGEDEDTLFVVERGLRGVIFAACASSNRGEATEVCHGDPVKPWVLIGGGTGSAERVGRLSSNRLSAFVMRISIIESLDRNLRGTSPGVSSSPKTRRPNTAARFFEYILFLLALEAT